ncbi:plasmid maintenance protein [Borreliella garinii]|uniref:plasmid maintenance protein n=1 Tax=Borreliella garinii TaxID=29519 RepID=UPI00067EE398|nr:plasmid maintenance protein [Borreliella garinii]
MFTPKKSISKDKIKYNVELELTEKIVQKLINLNCQKSCINDITVSQVKFLIKKMVINKFNRLAKVYWAIDLKNKQYKETGGAKCYSACDIYKIVASLLERDGKKVVCMRTVRNDIKILNEMHLLRSIIRKLGKGKRGGYGSVAHYVQNMLFSKRHKQIILEHLVKLLEENLKDKKIVGDFDKAIQDVEFKVENLEQPINHYFQNGNVDLPVNIISAHTISAQYNKANIGNINIKNSILNSKTQKLKSNFKKNNLENSLMERNVPENFLHRVKGMSNNQTTYINALYNLETALKEYTQYELVDVLEHFFEQFSSKYKYKVWMMMKRSDGVVSDYKLIWQERFREFIKNKESIGKNFINKAQNRKINLDLDYDKKQKNIEKWLIEKGVSNDFLYRVKDLSNNQANYVDSLYNLKYAMNDHKDSKLKYVLEHFLDQFSNKYRYKVWMMMKRGDGGISDYDVIWKERFKEFVKKKVQLNAYVKKVLEMEVKEIEVRNNERLNKLKNEQTQESKMNSGNHNQESVDEVLEKISRNSESNIAKDCLGFKTTKGITLDSLGIG